VQKLARFVGDPYAMQLRTQFADSKGSSELAMLQAPSNDEFEQIKRAVAIMTPDEKKKACDLSDEQVQGIAQDAKADTGIIAIFINGLILENKRVL
jgi:hypothetical protein